jgi:hypothetical protein
VNPAYASARLNRANARMRLGAMPEAVEDYRYYLTLEPRSPKRAQIENLIAFVAEEAVIAEQRRITEEEQARAEVERVRQEEERERVASEERARVEAERVQQEAEQVRQEEERQRIASEERARVEAERAQQEAERRRRLLEEVSASLQADAGETRGLSAGSERPQDYDGEFELE